MLSLLLFVGALRAAPSSSSACYHLDGSVSILNPREDDRYGYTFDDEHVLCRRFGHEYAREVQTKTALWGAYESVHLSADGEISAPATATTIAKRLLCFSVTYLSLN